MIGIFQCEVVVGLSLWKCEDGGKTEDYGELNMDGREVFRKFLLQVVGKIKVIDGYGLVWGRKGKIDKIQ